MHDVKVARALSTIGCVLLASGVLLVTGCAVGPDYVQPTAPMAPEFKELQGWKMAEPQDTEIRSAWWEVFGDPELNELTAAVSVSNQTLMTAEAQFRQARTLVWAARAAWYPTAAIGVSATRAQRSANFIGSFGGAGKTFNDFAMPLSVSWEADVWGRIRRTVESNTAGAQASAADVDATRLSLQAELAVDYFQLRTVDAQEQLLERTVAGYQRSLQLTQNRYEGGIASRADVAQAQTQLETTRAQAIDLGVQRAALEHAIAVLIGRPPSELSIAPRPLDETPPPVPVSLPSRLLERRPDIAAFERQMAAANAQIGVAEAAYFPTVTLSATGGFESADVSTWFTWPSRVWSVGPAVTETVYDGGLRYAQMQGSLAAYDATVAAYRETVLTAFQEVEDNLAALRILEDESHVQDEAVRAAQDSASLTTERYKGGTSSYLDVVVTQAAELANERTAVDILGRRMLASVRLIAALGGGWTAADLPTAPALAAGGRSF